MCCMLNVTQSLLHRVIVQYPGNNTLSSHFIMIRLTINHTKGEHYFCCIEEFPLHSLHPIDLSSLTIAKLQVQNDGALIVVLI